MIKDEKEKNLLKIKRGNLSDESVKNKRKFKSGIEICEKNICSNTVDDNICLMSYDKNICSVECKICSMQTYIEFDWKSLIECEFIKKYFTSLKLKLHNSVEFYPPIEKVFKFTQLTPFNEIKLVILGQEPYYCPFLATGLAFSVDKAMQIPPTLKNIFLELKNDIPDFVIPKHGDLSEWSKQGVVLLNSTLTVCKNKPLSHSSLGWKNLTDQILTQINQKLERIVFIFWGSHARSKAKLIDQSRHLILEAGHPSPNSMWHFKDCKHFSKANQFLIDNGKKPIDWKITS
jgi:uracil-DNA glycosylase